jgi:hypothetical protein
MAAWVAVADDKKQVMVRIAAQREEREGRQEEAGALREQVDELERGFCAEEE